jgi:hypothetical protein
MDRVNCGLVSLRSLTRVTTTPLLSSRWLAVTKAYSRPILSMADVQRAGRELGLELAAWRMTAEELRAEGKAGIVHLKEDHFVALVDFCGDVVRYLEADGVHVVPRAAFTERFSGHCLLPSDPAGARTGIPSLEFSSVDFGVGTIRSRDALTHTFTCRNTGPDSIRMSVSQTSPDCSAEVVGGGDEVPPGESCHIRLIGEPQRGRFVCWAELLTSDAHRPVAYLTLHGTWPRALLLRPQALWLAASVGEPGRQRLWVSGSADLRVEQVASSLEFVEASAGEPWTPRADEGRGIPLWIETARGTPVGGWQGQLTIKTNDPASPIAVVPITVRVAGNIDTQPPSAYFGLVKAGSSGVSSHVLSCRAPDSPPIVVLRARCENPHVHVEVVPPAPGARPTVRIRVDSRTPPGVVDTTVILNTDAPGEERIELPVYAHVVE